MPAKTTTTEQAQPTTEEVQSLLAEQIKLNARAAEMGLYVSAAILRVPGSAFDELAAHSGATPRQYFDSYTGALSFVTVEIEDVRLHRDMGGA